MTADTIFESVTGFPLLTWEEANEKVVDLSRRNAALERALAAAGGFCILRRSGFCYSDCLARMVCDVTGLIPMPYIDLPEYLTGGIRET
jgi:hypothetical protein